MLGANKMRQFSIVTVVVWAVAIVALFGASALIARVPHKAEVAAASSSIDIVQMTRDARRLPIEQYDAN